MVVRSAPMITFGSASSTISSSSRFGSRDETGCGVAPSFQHATVAATNSTLFGSAIVTKSPCSTPSAGELPGRAVREPLQLAAGHGAVLVGDGEVLGIGVRRDPRCAARRRSSAWTDSDRTRAGGASARTPRSAAAAGEQRRERAQAGDRFRVGHVLAPQRALEHRRTSRPRRDSCRSSAGAR